ncbi:hypothetical protein [Verrucomicrobium sp. GAS474]|uniref:hypothetical protein n=1 Tax=Verrucomicrobium sp. GAS474 TaxID=1882831 RepID=UPI0012FF99FB|nr:hypothetical protein [Verrucomicrobium sp. GAS474]
MNGQDHLSFANNKAQFIDHLFVFIENLKPTASHSPREDWTSHSITLRPTLALTTPSFAKRYSSTPMGSSKTN